MSARAAMVVLLTGLCGGLGAVAGAPFLVEEGSARAQALGGAYGAEGGTLEGLFFNPASIADLGSGRAAVTHHTGTSRWNYDWLAAGGPVGDWAMALQAGLARFDPVPLYDAMGRQIGQLEAGNQVIGVGVARHLPWKGSSAGLLVHGFQSQLADYSSRGASLDLGLQWKGRRLGAGFSGQNFGGQSAFVSAADPLPWGLRMDLAFAAYQSPRIGIHIKGEGAYFPEAPQVAPGRFGIELISADSLMAAAGIQVDRNKLSLAAGAGAKIGWLEFFLSWLPDQVAGDAFLVSLGMKWAGRE